MPAICLPLVCASLALGPVAPQPTTATTPTVQVVTVDAPVQTPNTGPVAEPVITTIPEVGNVNYAVNSSPETATQGAQTSEAASSSSAQTAVGPTSNSSGIAFNPEVPQSSVASQSSAVPPAYHVGDSGAEDGSQNFYAQLAQPSLSKTASLILRLLAVGLAMIGIASYSAYMTLAKVRVR